MAVYRYDCKNINSLKKFYDYKKSIYKTENFAVSNIFALSHIIENNRFYCLEEIGHCVSDQMPSSTYDKIQDML